MKLRLESAEHKIPPQAEENQINSENRVSIEGYLKIALADLEEDFDQAQRIQSIAHILMPEKYGLEDEDKDFLEEVNSIKENYHHPAAMINFLRQRQGYAGDDHQLGQEIRSIQSAILIQELKKLDSDHPLLKEFKQEQFLLKQQQSESNTVPLLKDSLEESQDESIAQIDICTEAGCADDILKREQGFLPEVEEFMPVIWLQYPIGSPRMLYVYLKIHRIFSEFNLPSYKVLDKEYNEVDGIRGRYDNIFIYLTPHLSLEKILQLMAVLGKPKDKSEEVFLRNLEFHFSNTHLSDVGHYKQNIEFALSKVPDFKRRCLSLSYLYLYAMNSLLRLDLKVWNEDDVQLAIRLTSDFDREEMTREKDFRGALRLPSAELDLMIAKYYNSKENLKIAQEYYYSAKKRLVVIPSVHIDAFNLDVFSRARVYQRPTAHVPAKRLSALVRCLDSLIIAGLRLGESVDTINDHIRSLNGYIDELQKTQSLTVLTIYKREEIPVLNTSQDSSKEILKTVQPMQQFPRSAFFNQQIQSGFQFNLAAFLRLTQFPNSKVKHIRKHLVSGIEIYLENPEDSALLYDTLLKILADGDEKKYGGHLHHNEAQSCVEITFKAYTAFIRCLEIVGSVSNEYAAPALQSTDVVSLETLRRILHSSSVVKTPELLTTGMSDDDLYGNDPSSSDESSCDVK